MTCWIWPICAISRSLAQSLRKCSIDAHMLYPAASLLLTASCWAATAWSVIDASLAEGNSEHRREALAAIGTIAAPDPEAIKCGEEALMDGHRRMKISSSASKLPRDWGNAETLPALEYSIPFLKPKITCSRDHRRCHHPDSGPRRRSRFPSQGLPQITAMKP